jgi:hypothetical protein
MMSLRASVLRERSNPLPSGDCFAEERLAMTTLWQEAHASALRAAQSKTEKELRLRTLMPSVPALSLSKGWIGRLRESCKNCLVQEQYHRSLS